MKPDGAGDLERRLLERIGRDPTVLAVHLDQLIERGDPRSAILGALLRDGRATLRGAASLGLSGLERELRLTVLALGSDEGDIEWTVLPALGPDGTAVRPLRGAPADTAVITHARDAGWRYFPAALALPLREWGPLEPDADRPSLRRADEQLFSELELGWDEPPDSARAEPRRLTSEREGLVAFGADASQACVLYRRFLSSPLGPLGWYASGAPAGSTYPHTAYAALRAWVESEVRRRQALYARRPPRRP